MFQKTYTVNSAVMFVRYFSSVITHFQLFWLCWESCHVNQRQRYMLVCLVLASLPKKLERCYSLFSSVILPVSPFPATSGYVIRLMLGILFSLCLQGSITHSQGLASGPICLWRFFSTISKNMPQVSLSCCVRSSGLHSTISHPQIVIIQGRTCLLQVMTMWWFSFSLLNKRNCASFLKSKLFIQVTCNIQSIKTNYRQTLT